MNPVNWVRLTCCWFVIRVHQFIQSTQDYKSLCVVDLMICASLVNTQTGRRLWPVILLAHPASHVFPYVLTKVRANRNICSLPQVLAINRVESLKILKVSVNIPDRIKEHFVRLCVSHYEPRYCDGSVKLLVSRSANDAYDRLVQPMLIRGFRWLSTQSVMLFLT